ncbi:MAG: anti-sigma factor [Dehalococcoidia bacterium]
MRQHLTQEQADEYAVGALDPEEAVRIALHAESCHACARLVAESERVAAVLLFAVDRVAPPPRLRERVLRAAGLSAPGPLVWTARLIGAGAGVAAIVVAIAALTGLVSVRSQVKDVEQQNELLQAQIDDALSQKVEIAALTQKLDDQAKEAADIRSTSRLDRDLLLALLSPDSNVAEVFSVDENSFAIGRFIWDPEQRRAWFVASRLPKLSDGQAYQLWVNAAGHYISLGSFNADDSGFARFQALIPQGVDGYENAVVTVEAASGVSERSGPAVFVADLANSRR